MSPRLPQGSDFHLPQVSIHSRLCLTYCEYADSVLQSSRLSCSDFMCIPRSSKSVGCARELRTKYQTDSFSDRILLAYCSTFSTISSRSSIGSIRASKKRRNDQPDMSLGCLKHQAQTFSENADTTQSNGKGTSTSAATRAEAITNRRAYCQA